MKQTLLPIILLIGLVGRGQTFTDYFKHIKIQRGVVVDFNPADSNYTARLDTAHQPRTATAWASLQNEVNELKKQVDSLKEREYLWIDKIDRMYDRQADERPLQNKRSNEIYLLVYNLRIQLDSLIKALRDRDAHRGIFIPGRFLVTADSSFLSGDITIPTHPYGDSVTITVDTTKWMRRLDTGNPSSSNLRFKIKSGHHLLGEDHDSKVDTAFFRGTLANWGQYDPGTIFDTMNKYYDTSCLCYRLPPEIIDRYRTNIADPAAAKVVHFNNGCDLGTVKHGKGWARKHKVKK